jgi:predicted TIM-barrel fold metal-dependent hydrolase
MRILILFACAYLCFGQPPAPRYLDAHVHYRDSPEFVANLVATYRKLGAMACLSARPAQFDKLSEAARRHPEVILPVMWLDLDDPAVLQHVDKAQAAGWRGLKIHSPRRNYDDESYSAVFARAERYRMVTLLHTGISSRPADNAPRRSGSMARMRPMYLDTLAREFPDLTLVGAHLGNPWYDEAAEAARWNPNLYFDMTGSTLVKKGADLAFFRQILWWGPTAGQMHMPKDTPHAFEKIVFGTDNDPLDVALDRYKKVMDACGVPDAVRAKVLSQTIWRKLHRQ